MRARNKRGQWAAFAAVAFVALGHVPLMAQKSAPVQSIPAPANLPPAQPSAPHRLTLEEANQRAQANSKVIALAAANADGKDYAIRAARADYFPKVIGSTIYFHFDHPLGSVLTTRGRPRLGVPANQVAV